MDLQQNHLLLGTTAPNQPDLLWKKRKRERTTHLGQGEDAKEKVRDPGQRRAVGGKTAHLRRELASALRCMVSYSWTARLRQWALIFSGLLIAGFSTQAESGWGSFESSESSSRTMLEGLDCRGRDIPGLHRRGTLGEARETLGKPSLLTNSPRVFAQPCSSTGAAPGTPGCNAKEVNMARSLL